MNQSFNANTALLLCALVCFLTVPELAHAQAAAQDGAPFWQKLKDFVFGPVGLSLAFVGFIWGIVAWFDQGFKASVGYFIAVVVFFFLPTAAMYLQNLART